MVPAQPAERTEVRTTVPVRAVRPPRQLAVALAGTVVFALLAAFFAWQAAEPLWLALGHGEPGTATVSQCHASEHVTYRCVVFQAGSGAFEVADVTLLGAGDAADAEGAQLPASMVSAGHDRAYAVGPAGLHLRWSISLLLVLACGAGIAWATGATRLDGRDSRRRAVLVSFAGPLLLAVGFLTAAL